MKASQRLSSLADLGTLFPNPDPGQTPPAKPRPGHDGKGTSVRVRLDAKGRKGKQVTLVEGLHHNPATIEEIARTLKQHCGAGGTVKEGAIEIQGDHRTRVTEKLREMNYAVKG
jgi:translation initiation factor 1